jgi:hypothetical protein
VRLSVMFTHPAIRGDIGHARAHPYTSLTQRK